MRTRAFVILFCVIVGFAMKIKAQDTAIFSKNEIRLEFFGNGYLSPYFDWFSAGLGITPLSVNYERVLQTSRGKFRIGAGVGLFKTWWLEYVGNGSIPHRSHALSASLGIVWKLNKERQNGFWIGCYFIEAFGKQTFDYYDNFRGTTFVTVESDYQISPNVCYLAQTKNQHLSARISWTPKVKFSNEPFSKGPGVFPFWGGISIGGAW